MTVKIKELIAFIESLVPGTYFPNSFPESTKAPDKCSAVRITGGFPTSQWTGKKQPSFQIRVRGESGASDEEVESRAYDIHNALENLRNIKIGDHSVVVIRPMTSVPQKLGNDENNRPIYTMNFDTVIRPPRRDF